MDLLRFSRVVVVLSVILVTGVAERCRNNHWQCDDGACILRSWRCDGTGDCLDGSDEMDCSCSQDDFECADATTCVPRSVVCDGRSHCNDGSDELNCSRPASCLLGDWTCRNRLCIPQDLHCNKVNDCADDSDEEDCGLCGDLNVRCPNGTCLMMSERCDGVSQCADSSDEPVTCGKTCKNRNGGCSHMCTDQLWGALCSCPSGMKLASNGAKCEDVDECDQPFGPCMHTCINTKGSFQCTCRPGFTLQDDACQVEGNATKLLTTKKGLIGLVSVKARVFSSLFAIDVVPVALAFDLARKFFYWADGNGNIYKAEDQTSRVLYSGHDGVTSLAVDWLSGQLYWTSLNIKGIHTGTSDGSAVSIVTPKDTNPMDLVLLPTESTMFWINKGLDDSLTIERAGMDGFMRDTLVVVTAELPRGLTLDVAERRLYWISGFKMSIETVRVDGTGRHTFKEFFKGKMAQSLAAFNNWFYWTENGRLWEAPQNEPDKKTFILKASLPILTVHHELQQPRGPSSCRRSGCQLCLPSLVSTGGFTCSCPEGKLPMPSGSCENFKIAYATSTSLYTLEYTADGPLKVALFSTDEDIQSFDLDWKKGWVIWANATGHVKARLLSEEHSEYIPTLKPVCTVRVDQNTENLYWVSCDELSIGVTHVSLPHQSFSKQLYQARGEISDLFVDWQRGQLYWLEDGQIINMRLGLMGGNAKAIYSFEEAVRHITMDKKANGFLWSSQSALQVLSLLKMRKYSAGKAWTIPGLIVASYEPYMVTLLNDDLTLWKRQDGTRIRAVAVEAGIIGITIALREQRQDKTPENGSPTPTACRRPSVSCRGTSVCISQTQLCDGNSDCLDGSDEASCVYRCETGEFLCKDRRKCIEGNLVCDGRSHCTDGSDEVDCPTPAAKTTNSGPLKCRLGSRPCKDGSDCVLHSHVCDGEDDCKDGSDEEGCDSNCKAGQFQCAHGRMCIERKQVCDGTPQCQDRSDEMDCFTRTGSCSHRCDDKTRCIPDSFLCDGEKDCVDGTDEAECAPPTVGPSSDLSAKTICKSPSVMCKGTSLCISQSQLCDGNLDCPNGSDELSCLHECSDPGHFLCKNRMKCIERALVCDGRSDCPDGSDELQCPACPLHCDEGLVCLTSLQFCDGQADCGDGTDERDCSNGGKAVAGASSLKCPVGFKACRDGKECVLYSHVCDGERDCKDGSDEKGCERKCKKDQFQCAHGRMCIEKKQVCDGTPQCQDRSDEMDCFTRTSSCSHRCDNKTRCIPDSFLCDGEKDCVDGTDEDGCAPKPCLVEQYQCASGQCVSLALRCDGHTDCHDHSDERDCHKPPHCPLEERCRGSHECLQTEWLCDGDKDCSDGSDEQNCKTPLQCGPFQWQCASKHQCIPTSWRCDGSTDCKDQSDEAGCPIGQAKCPPHLFMCGNKGCVDPKRVCDGLPDCWDGSDEGAGCLHGNCSSPSRPLCGHYCMSTPQGARCGCREGYVLQADGFLCVDLDECEEVGTPPCSHKCVNTHGSYVCRCHPGYILEPDGSSCKTAEEPDLLASVQYELLLKGLRSGNLQVLLPLDQKPIFSLDYDQVEERLFWVSLQEESIKYAFHGHKDNIKALVKGVKSDSIAVDWVGRNLYWVDGVAGQILAVRLSNSLVKPDNYIVILDEDLEQPRSLALLPQKGLMLWSEIGSEARIERAGMDGSDRRLVVRRGLSWPVALAVDALTERVYWTDEKLKCIGSAMLDGEDVKLLQLTEMPSPFSVAVFNDMVYWSDTQRRAVYGAHKVTGKNPKVILKRPGQPFGLKVAHTLMQPKVSNSCENLGCSHMCLLTPGSGAVCRCPARQLLAADRVTCSPPEDSSSSFLLLLSPTMLTQIFTSSLRGDVGLKRWPTHRAMALPGINEASGLDLVLADQTLYLADAGQAAVARLRLADAALSPEGSPLQLPGDAVTALAVDWLTHNLYWSSTRQPWLHVTSAGWKYTAMVLQAELQEPTSVALHPPTARLCFTAMGPGKDGPVPQLECASMSGQNRLVLWKSAQLPMFLSFSSQGSTLYWADVATEVIASVNIDGSTYREYKTRSPLIVSFAQNENIFFWVTLYNGSTKVWYSDGVQPKQVWFEVQTNIVALKAYSRYSQKGTNLCGENNGGCSHLCLAYPAGRTCRCTQGYLSVNTTWCVPGPQCPPGSELCRDGYTCLSVSKFCDQVPDCQDGSDEKDCAYMKTKPGFPQDNVLLNPMDGQSCGSELCGGRGRCVWRNREPSCDCVQGYSGPACQYGGSSRAPVILSILFLVTIVIMAAVALKKRREKSAREQPIEKETLMKDMEEPEAHPQNFANELYNPEEEEQATSIN